MALCFWPIRRWCLEYVRRCVRPYRLIMLDAMWSIPDWSTCRYPILLTRHNNVPGDLLPKVGSRNGNALERNMCLPYVEDRGAKCLFASLSELRGWPVWRHLRCMFKFFDLPGECPAIARNLVFRTYCPCDFSLAVCDVDMLLTRRKLSSHESGHRREIVRTIAPENPPSSNNSAHKSSASHLLLFEHRKLSR
jgi:hypothetical protein